MQVRHRAVLDFEITTATMAVWPGSCSFCSGKVPDFVSIANPIFYLGLMAAYLLAGQAIARWVPFYKREVTTEPSTRFESLDGLRGLLAFGVFFHHARLTWEFYTSGKSSWEAPEHGLYHALGPVSVAFFFCITAFLFWGKAIAAGYKISPLRLLQNRLRRIAPMYWVSLIPIGIILFILSPGLPAHPGYVAWRSFLSSLAGVFDLPLDKVGDVPACRVNAGVFWTLRYEWGFYMALPVLALVFRRTWAFFTFIALLFAGSIVDASLYPGHIISFAVGMIAAWLFNLRPEIRWLKSGYITCACLSLLLLVPRAMNANDVNQPTLWTLPATLLIALPFFAAVYGNSFFGLLTLPGAKMLGTISYSVYLLHGIVLFAGMRWLNSVWPLKQMAPALYWCLAGLSGLITLGIASLTYRYVEFPWLKSKKRGASATSAKGAIPSPVPTLLEA